MKTISSENDHQALIDELSDFILNEQQVALEHLYEIWQQPLTDKLKKGLTQSFRLLARGKDAETLYAYPDKGESRFREGDLLILHSGSPFDNKLCGKLSFEKETDEYWVLRGRDVSTLWSEYQGEACFGDCDSIDLTDYFKKTLDEIATSQIGQKIILPLLMDSLDITFDDRDYDDAEKIAVAEGCNYQQAEAVALAYSAEQLACIQGPPGTGKTRVLSIIVRLMVERGERVLMTSHTHMAINNALNKIHAQGVPTVKIGQKNQSKGLLDDVKCVNTIDDWEERPHDGGYVVGATPFATCSQRLENHTFDVIIFDEASQVTIPLALMAMRKGKRFIFIGDQKQLPPVLLSKSILSEGSLSIFSKLTSPNADHCVMLNETYRMNEWLTEWPSKNYYQGKLVSAGNNKRRTLQLENLSPSMAEILGSSHCSIFIPTLDLKARNRNYSDVELIIKICESAKNATLALSDIGIVTPFRAQGRAIRNGLIKKFGREQADSIVADTVERMQGQEREMIIISMSSGDEVFLEAIAEFFFQPERLNVSITRAMTKLVIIGPELSLISIGYDERVVGWISQYKELIESCQKVELK